MFGMAATYDPRQHELISPPLLEWCRRQASGVEDPTLAGRLFCYRHRVHNTFVVGAWIAEPRGMFIDLMNLGHSLQNFDGKEFIRRLYQPLTAEQTKKQLAEEESRDLHERQDMVNEEIDNLKRRKRNYGY